KDGEKRSARTAYHHTRTGLRLRLRIEISPQGLGLILIGFFYVVCVQHQFLRKKLDLLVECCLAVAIIIRFRLPAAALSHDLHSVLLLNLRAPCPLPPLTSTTIWKSSSEV